MFHTPPGMFTAGRLFLLFLSGVSCLAGQCQTAKSSQRSAASHSAPQSLTATSLSIAGLKSPTVIENFYLGDFEKIDFGRDDLQFSSMLGQYISSYWHHCGAYLPPNKVHMTHQHCLREQHMENRYGTQVGPSTCLESETIDDGWADPALYNASTALTAQTAKSVLTSMFKVRDSNNTISGMTAGVVATMTPSMTLADDVATVVAKNACLSPALKRFQENILLFALGKQPVRINGSTLSSPAIDKPSAGASYKDSNYRKFLNDLITEESKTWMMNHYVGGSLSDVSVSRDSSGRPARITAGFTSQSYSGQSHNSVTLQLSDGVPECLYFADLPSTCKTPNRKLVAAYASGSYQ
jgi:hypothetical protein